MKAKFTLVTIMIGIIALGMFQFPSSAMKSEIVVAIWLFDKADGKVVEDLSENGHDGEIQGNVKGAKGKNDNALEFPGKGDSYVLIPHDDNFNLTTFSITAWINLKDTGAYHGLVEKVEGDTRNFYMAIYPNDKVFYGGFRANNAWNNALTKTDVLDEKWHHLAVTYDQKYIRGYVNGVLEDEKALSLKPELNNGPVTIGVTGTGGAEPTSGLIDEVGIFNDALTESEVKSIMKNGLKVAVMAVSGPSEKYTVTWGNIKTR